MAGIKRQKRFPIGYRIQNGRAEVVPEEAELVQRIFRDYLEGSTTYGIVDDRVGSAECKRTSFMESCLYRKFAEEPKILRG